MDNRHFHDLAKTIHWLTVIAIILVYSTGYYRYWFTTQLEVANWYLLVAHMNLGLSIFVLTILSLISRCYLVKPSPVMMSKFKKKLTQIGHFCLFAILIVMPISAYIGTGFDVPILGQYLLLPSFPRFEFSQTIANIFNVPLIGLMDPFSRFHQDIAADYILPTLLIIHIGAALHHHYILKDQTLIRIWPKAK